MPIDLNGKVALVTGGSSGIGKAAAQVLAEHGASVVIGARRVAESEETVAEIKAAGGEAKFLQTDVTDDAQVGALVDFAVAEYGRLDCAFNNSGIGIPSELDWPDEDSDRMDRIYDVNVRGVWLSMKHELRVMLKSGGGSIVNNSSVAGLRATPGEAYTSSKYAVNGLTATASIKYGRRGIRVNAIAPGVILTQMWQKNFDADSGLHAAWDKVLPLGRVGSPREIGDAVAWLCSDMSSYVTGAIIPVDGGMIQTMANPGPR